MMLGASLTYTFAQTGNRPAHRGGGVALALARYGWWFELRGAAVSCDAARRLADGLWRSGIVLDTVVCSPIGKEPRSLPSALAASRVDRRARPRASTAGIAGPLVGLTPRRACTCCRGARAGPSACRPWCRTASAARLMGIPSGVRWRWRSQRQHSVRRRGGRAIAPLSTSLGHGHAVRLKVFAVAILGGIAWGVMAAGLLFGLVEAGVTTTARSRATRRSSASRWSPPRPPGGRWIVRPCGKI